MTTTTVRVPENVEQDQTAQDRRRHEDTRKGKSSEEQRGYEIQINKYVNSLPDDKILDWSNLKEIADDILKCI